nr:sugar phosphate nucleotidyltransferase [Salinisphaera sp. G21_0]
MIKKCLFPAAGYGTRFLPATKSMPKEMMPIVSKPLIEYGVEEALQAGMNDICIVTGRGKRSLEDHFDANYELEHQIAGSDKESLLKYGVIAGQAISDDLIRVETMMEMPAKEDAPSKLAIIGRYILTPDIFDLIRDTRPGKGGEIQITDALMAQAQRACVLAYKFKGRRFDVAVLPGLLTLPIIVMTRFIVDRCVSIIPRAYIGYLLYLS